MKTTHTKPIHIKEYTGYHVVIDENGATLGKIRLCDTYHFHAGLTPISESDALAIWSALRRLNQGKELKPGPLKGPSMANGLTLE